MNEVVNKQRKIKIPSDGLTRFADLATASIAETNGRAVTVAFVSDRAMRELNLEFRGADKTTDVLSFPFEPDEFDDREDFLGDIVISAEQASHQAEENGLSLDAEIKQLILHGILHLCGYDHETDTGEMNTRELELRDKLRINQ
jgi:probable rRNA maturation factor